MAGDDAEAERVLWDRMAQREPDVFVPRGPAPERLLLDNHRRWSAAPTSTTPLGVLVPPTVTVASGNLVMGVDPGLLTVAAPLEGGLSLFLRDLFVLVCCFLLSHCFVEIVLSKLLNYS